MFNVARFRPRRAAAVDVARGGRLDRTALTLLQFLVGKPVQPALAPSAGGMMIFLDSPKPVAVVSGQGVQPIARLDRAIFRLGAHRRIPVQVGLMFWS